MEQSSNKLLQLACKELVNYIGTCPRELCSVDLDCENRCSSNMDGAKCWEIYFTDIKGEKKL